MLRTTLNRNKEGGVALVIVLIVLLVLSTLVASLIFATSTEVWASANYKLLTQARYTAEAGAQATENWLVYTYTAPSAALVAADLDLTKSPVVCTAGCAAVGPVVLSSTPGATNYPDAAVAAKFPMNPQALPGAPKDTYSTTVTLLSMTPSAGVSWLPGGGGTIQTWQIASVGTINGVRNGSVQVVETIQRSGTPVFNYALEATSTACKAIYFGGSDGADSYNSTTGPYGGTNVVASGGDLATNGNVTLASGAVIDGTIYDSNNVTKGACPDGITSSGSYQGASLLPAKINPPLPWGCASLPCYPSPLPPTTAQTLSTSTCGSISGCTYNGTTSIYDNGSKTTVNVYTLAPGDYGNVTVSNADVVHMAAGTYNLNSLNFAKDGQIVVDSGPVVLNLAGQGFYAGNVVMNSGGLSGINLCGGGVTGNPGTYTTTTCGSGKSAFSGIPNQMQIVYAGNASISTTGAPFAAVIYAPNAPVAETGGAVGFYGSVVCSTFNESSKAPFHYDNSLKTTVIQAGPYHVTGFSWSKF